VKDKAGEYVCKKGRRHCPYRGKALESMTKKVCGADVVRPGGPETKEEIQRVGRASIVLCGTIRLFVASRRFEGGRTGVL